MEIKKCRCYNFPEKQRKSKTEPKVIMAFILFCLLKTVNKITSIGAKKEEEPAPTTKVCPFCRSEIDIEATRCPHCTSILNEAEKEEL